MCGGFPPHQQAILEHQESPKRLLLAPHTHFRCQSKVQIITWASDQLAINQRVPWEGSVNLLELLTELRETLTYIEHFVEVYGKGNGWTPRWRQCTGWGIWEGGGGLCRLWVNHSPRTYLEVLWTPYFWDFVEASSQRHDWSSTPFSALPSFQEDGAKNSKLPIMAWPFWWPALIQESNQSHSMEQKTLPSPRKLQELHELCVRKGVQRPKLEQEMTLVLSLRKLQRF